MGYFRYFFFSPPLQVSLIVSFLTPGAIRGERAGNSLLFMSKAWGETQSAASHENREGFGLFLFCDFLKTNDLARSNGQKIRDWTKERDLNKAGLAFVCASQPRSLWVARCNF